MKETIRELLTTAIKYANKIRYIDITSETFQIYVNNDICRIRNYITSLSIITQPKLGKKYLDQLCDIFDNLQNVYAPLDIVILEDTLKFIVDIGEKDYEKESLIIEKCKSINMLDKIVKYDKKLLEVLHSFLHAKYAKFVPEDYVDLIYTTLHNSLINADKKKLNYRIIEISNEHSDHWLKETKYIFYVFPIDGTNSICITMEELEIVIDDIVDSYDIYMCYIVENAEVDEFDKKRAAKFASLVKTSKANITNTKVFKNFEELDNWLNAAVIEMKL